MKLRLTALAVVATALVVAGCGGADDSTNGSGSNGGSGSTNLALVAFSTPEVVYDELIPDFQKTDAGKNTKFSTSFGASGEQSRAVLAGQKADVVNLSLEPDVTKLVDAKLVPSSWNKGQYDGFVTNSLVSFIVRKGNPKHITSWDDIVKPGVKVVTPNPFTSGAAKWNLLGAYQHGGLDFVKKVIANTSVQPKSGREALQTFTAGEGDVLISYEYEYTTAVKKGTKNVQLVVPNDTLLIQNPIAATTKANPAAQAFVNYTLSPAGQQHFADWGYRPVNKAVFEKNKSKFATPAKVVTIAQLGGWPKLNNDLFDPENGSVAKIEEDAGVSTAK